MSWRTRGFVVLAVLIIAEIASKVIYYIFANRMDELCYEHNDELRHAGEVCSHIASAASHAFSTASMTHLPIILVIVIFFFSLTKRLDALEAQVQKLGESSDA